MGMVSNNNSDSSTHRSVTRYMCVRVSKMSFSVRIFLCCTLSQRDGERGGGGEDDVVRGREKATPIAAAGPGLYLFSTAISESSVSSLPLRAAFLIFFTATASPEALAVALNTSEKAPLWRRGLGEVW